MASAGPCIAAVRGDGRQRRRARRIRAGVRIPRLPARRYAQIRDGAGRGPQFRARQGQRTGTGRASPESSTSRSNTRRTTLQDAAISVKRVPRNGVLQDVKGPSVASECGILLPTVEGERTGAACTGIVSAHWGQSTVHFNAALGKNREGRWEKFLDAIVVGPGFSIAHPVFEAFVARDSAGGYTKSALAGVVWTIKDNLSFDVGLRKVWMDAFSITELRMGFTWSRPLHQQRRAFGD